MYEVQEDTYAKAYKPYDVVSKNGCFGHITEVSVNTCQKEPNHQIQYAVTWYNGIMKYAWFSHDELAFHCNLFVKIAEASCHPHGHNSKHVEKLLTISRA